MAIFSISISIVCRSKGRQICASAAYQAREKIFDIRQNLTFTYRNRDGEELLATQIMLPVGAPDWDRSTLWNECEKAERRKDSQTARSIRLALPRELSFDEMLELVRNFLTEQFLSRGLACDFAIHIKNATDGGQQPHVHILVTTRTLSATGWAQKKDRKTLCSPADLRRFRADWAAAVNASLLSAGFDVEIDHRSLSEQRRAIEEYLDSDQPDRKNRQKLHAALHGLSRIPEGKACRQEWQAAHRNGGLPTSIELIRAAREIALTEADELLVLYKDRRKILALAEENGSQLDPDHITEPHDADETISEDIAPDSDESVAGIGIDNGGHLPNSLSPFSSDGQ